MAVKKEELSFNVGTSPATVVDISFSSAVTMATVRFAGVGLSGSARPYVQYHNGTTWVGTGYDIVITSNGGYLEAMNGSNHDIGQADTTGPINGWFRVWNLNTDAYQYMESYSFHPARTAQVYTTNAINIGTGGVSRFRLVCNNGQQFNSGTIYATGYQRDNEILLNYASNPNTYTLTNIPAKWDTLCVVSRANASVGSLYPSVQTGNNGVIDGGATDYWVIRRNQTTVFNDERNTHVLSGGNGVGPTRGNSYAALVLNRLANAPTVCWGRAMGDVPSGTPYSAWSWRQEAAVHDAIRGNHASPTGTAGSFVVGYKM